MINEGFTNIKNLLKVRLIYGNKYIVLFLIISTISALLRVLITAYFDILRNNDGFQHIFIIDYSLLFSSLVIFILIFYFFEYKQTNAKLSAFPQTNNSRFISSLLVHHIGGAAMALIIPMVYLLNFGVISFFAMFRDNVLFALNIDVDFIIVGFFVYLAYIFVIIALFELIGTMLRKWTYYAAVPFIALAALIIINRSRVIEYAPGALAFLTGEPSLPLFFVKAFIVWLVVTAAALVINRFTNYEKSQIKSKAKSVVTGCAIIAVALAIIVPTIVFLDELSRDNFTASEADPAHVEDHFAGHNTIRIDISHLPGGSKINLRRTNIVIPNEEGYALNYNDKTEAVVHGIEALSDLQGDTLVIDFRPAEYIVNGIEMLQYTNPRMTARLDGYTLFLEFTRDKSTNVIFMQHWWFMRQFDYYNDKGVLLSNILGSGSGRWWRWDPTEIVISVE